MFGRPKIFTLVFVCTLFKTTAFSDIFTVSIIVVFPFFYIFSIQIYVHIYMFVYTVNKNNLTKTIYYTDDKRQFCLEIQC